LKSCRNSVYCGLPAIWKINSAFKKTLSPDGIYYKVEKHECLTTKANEFIALASSIAANYTEKENGNFQDFLENSRTVVLARGSSNRFWGDLPGLERVGGAIKTLLMHCKSNENPLTRS